MFLKQMHVACDGCQAETSVLANHEEVANRKLDIKGWKAIPTGHDTIKWNFAHYCPECVAKDKA